METKKKKQFWKKKWFWILIILIAAAVIISFVLRGILGRQQMAAALEAKSIQETTVTKGSLSDTIEGSGTLQVADTTDVKIPGNLTASEILVEEGDMVSKGQTIATLDSDSIVDALVEVETSLDDIDDTLDDDDDLTDLEIEQLKNKKTALKKVQDELEALKKDPSVAATADGTIASISLKTTDESNSSSDTSASASGSGTSASGTNGSSAAASSAAYRPAVGHTLAAQKYAGLTILKDEGQEDNLGSEVSSEEDESGDDGSEDDARTAVTDFSALGLAAPIVGSAQQDSVGNNGTYSAVINWSPQETFAYGGTYASTITMTAADGYTFTNDSVAALNSYIAGRAGELTDVSDYAWDISWDSGQITFVITYTMKSQPVTETPTPSPTKTPVPTNTPSVTPTPSVSPTQGAGSTSGMSSLSGSLSGSTSGLSGSSTASSSATSVSSLYKSYQTTAFTINNSDDVMVSISIDELDINSVEEGQKAVVTLDAMEDQEFEGQITKVADTASSTGGSSKFAVEITLPKSDGMKIGMSATAVITVSEAEDTLLIPMAALQERGNETFVYTQKDEEGNLSGEVTVETGLSDDSQVEITSGLSEGQVIYYTRTDSSSDSTENPFEAMGGGDMGGGMPSGGGDMPSGGGDMPSGGGGGGMPSGGGPGGN